MADQTDPFKSLNGSLFREMDPSESCSMAVVRAVAAVSNRESTKMAPLYESIDTDALDALLVKRGRFRRESGVEISFSYERQDVTVSSDGRLIVKPSEEAR